MMKRALTVVLFGSLLTFAVPQAAFSHEMGSDKPAPANSEEACRADHPAGDCGGHVSPAQKDPPANSHYDREAHDNGNTF